MFDEADCARVVGAKQCLKKMENEKCKHVCIAKDADKRIIQPVIDLAEKKCVEIVYIDTMKELGKVCGIDVGAAAAIVSVDKCKV